MIEAIIWMCIGGAIIFMFPGLGTAGNAWFKALFKR